MARMIPEYTIYLDRDCRWHGEREIYKALRDRTPSHWVAFHSVWSKNHEYKSESEADFIILTDTAVLVLEVKGGKLSRNSNGQWIQTGKNPEPIVRSESPFRQASGVTHAFRKYLRDECDRKDLADDLPWGYGVVTPHCDPVLPLNDPEIVPELLLPAGSFPSGIHDFLLRLGIYWETRNRKHKKSGVLIKEELISLLIPEIRHRPEGLIMMTSVRNSIINLTEQQIGILRSARENPRILLTGGAGTGKTVLAMEQAHIQAQKGNNVLVVCFNRLLAEYLKTVVPDDSSRKNITISTFSSFEKKRKNKNRWKYLIVDEGQDLMDDNHLRLLDEVLEGGMNNGEWLITLDNHQDIHGFFLNTGNDKGLVSVAVSLKLDMNCRNPIPVAEYNRKITLFQSFPRASVPGPEPIIDYYVDELEKEKLLKQHIEEEIARYREQDESLDIVLLARQRKDIPEDFFTPFYFSVDFRQYTMGIQDSIQWSTIHGFKGLESQTIILIGIDELENPEKKSLLYVAASRTTYRFIWLAHADLSDTILGRLIGIDE